MKFALIPLMLLLSVSANAIDVPVISSLFNDTKPTVYSGFNYDLKVNTENYTNQFTGWIPFSLTLRCKNDTEDLDLFYGTAVDVRADSHGYLVLNKTLIFKPGCSYTFNSNIYVMEPGENMSLTLWLRNDLARNFKPQTHYYQARKVSNESMNETIISAKKKFSDLQLPVASIILAAIGILCLGSSLIIARFRLQWALITAVAAILFFILAVLLY